MIDDEITTQPLLETTEEEVEESKEAPFTLNLPLQDEQLAELQAGQWVYVSGTIHIMGNQAGISLMDLWADGQSLATPIDWGQTAVYFATPGHAPIGSVLGSISPHQTHNFEGLTQQLCEQGVRCVMGRGPISEDAAQALKRKRGIYLVTVGGAGALLSQTVYQVQSVAMEELRHEAIRALKVEQFPCVVAIDAFGRNLYQKERHKRSSSPPETSHNTEEHE